MRGYKIFGPDYTCGGYKYSLDTPNVYSGSIGLHGSRFYFCRYARDCLNYYDINDTNTYALVECGDKYISVLDKIICDRIVIIKTLTRDEFRKLTDNGNYKKLYSNGKLYIETTYADGKIHGSYKEWHKNEKLSIETTYKNGELHGSYKRWNSNGKLWIETNYVDGKRSGNYKSWHPNGQLYSETTYVDGKEHGSYKRWHPNGQLDLELNYVNGEKV